MEDPQWGAPLNTQHQRLETPEESHMTAIDNVFVAISEERSYQKNKWGTIEDTPHTIPEWLTIMHNELSEAMQAWAKHSSPDDDVFALQEIVQVVAVGVACLEQHGLGRSRADADDIVEPYKHKNAFGSTRSADGRFPI